MKGRPKRGNHTNPKQTNTRKLEEAHNVVKRMFLKGAQRKQGSKQEKKMTHGKFFRFKHVILCKTEKIR